jgi:hypothetical protein
MRARCIFHHGDDVSLMDSPHLLCAQDEAAINAAGGSSGVMGLISTLSGSTHGNTGTRTIRCGLSLGCCMIAVQIPASVGSCALSLGGVRQGHRIFVHPTIASHPQHSFVISLSSCCRYSSQQRRRAGRRRSTALCPTPVRPTARSSARPRRAARCSRRGTNWTKRRSTRTSTTLTKVILMTGCIVSSETIPYATALLSSR